MLSLTVHYFLQSVVVDKPFSDNDRSDLSSRLLLKLKNVPILYVFVKSIYEYSLITPEMTNYFDQSDWLGLMTVNLTADSIWNTAKLSALRKTYSHRTGECKRCLRHIQRQSPYEEKQFNNRYYKISESKSMKSLILRLDRFKMQKVSIKVTRSCLTKGYLALC